MIKYLYAEDINVIKKEVNYDTSFSTFFFDTSSLISTINMVDLFNPISNFLIKITEINLEDILFVHNSLIHDDKKIYFILPEELQKKKLDFFALNNLDYTKLNTDTLSCLNYLKLYVEANNIEIDSLLLVKIAEAYENTNVCINEIDKLVAFAYPNKIKIEHYNTFATKSEATNIFSLIELYLTSKNEEALTLFDELIDSGYSEIALIETLYSQARLLLQVQVLRNNNPAAINGILKIHEFRIKSSIALLNKINKQMLYKFLKSLALVDYKYKNGSTELNNIKYEIIII